MRIYSAKNPYEKGSIMYYVNTIIDRDLWIKLVDGEDTIWVRVFHNVDDWLQSNFLYDLWYTEIVFDTDSKIEYDFDTDNLSLPENIEILTTQELKELLCDEYLV